MDVTHMRESVVVVSKLAVYGWFQLLSCDFAGLWLSSSVWLLELASSCDFWIFSWHQPSGLLLCGFLWISCGIWSSFLLADFFGMGSYFTTFGVVKVDMK